MARVLITETGLRVLPDAPEEYARKDAMFEFIRNLPGKYDETRVLDAEWDEKLSLARRAGDEWFVGSVAGNDSASIAIDLDFLTPGVTYAATLYEDGVGTTYETNRDGYNVRKTEFTSTDTVTHTIPAGGGQSIWLRPVPDPLAHWPMENNANDAVGLLHGTATGGAGFDTADARQGSAALSLDGTNDWVDLSPHEASFPLGDSARSVAAWFKAGAGYQNRSFFHYGADNNGQRFAITADRTAVSVAVHGHRWGVSGLSLSDDWHHVAVVYEAGGESDTIRIYLDGVLQTAGNLEGSSQTMNTQAGSNAGIGRKGEGDVHYDGKIDDVRLYGVALTQAQVTTLFTTVRGLLLAHWPMENNANDAVGSLHGTATGGAGFDTADAKQGSAALSLDGTDDWVDLSPHEASFPLGDSARSVAGWFKAGAGYQHQSFFTYGSTGSGGQRFGITADRTEVSVSVHAHKWGVSGLSLSDDWHHVAVVYEEGGASDTIRIYLDGVLQTAGNLGGSSQTMNTQAGGNAGIGRKRRTGRWKTTQTTLSGHCMEA